jgi:hypothetical protein
MFFACCDHMNKFPTIEKGRKIVRDMQKGTYLVTSSMANIHRRWARIALCILATHYVHRGTEEMWGNERNCIDEGITGLYITVLQFIIYHKLDSGRMKMLQSP